LSDQTTTEAPAAPADPAAPAEAPAAAPEAPQREQQQPETDRANPWENPDAAKAEIERLRRENASDRVNAKAAAAQQARDELAQQIGKALGIVKDDTPPSVDDLTAQLTTTQTAAQQAQLELAIYKAAAAKGADPSALLDSRSFMEQATADPGALDALIGTHLTSNPRFRATQAAAAGGADLGAGGAQQARIYTADQLNDHDFYMKNRADIQRALTEGRIRS
jgi:hypothetical protein